MGAKRKDPVTENYAMMYGRPVKAFASQDHDAHIQTVASAQENPEIIALVEKSPNAPAIQTPTPTKTAGKFDFAKVVRMLMRGKNEPDRTIVDEINYEAYKEFAPWVGWVGTVFDVVFGLFAVVEFCAKHAVFWSPKQDFFVA